MAKIQKGQNDKQRSTKHTQKTKDRATQTTQKLGVGKHYCIKAWLNLIKWIHRRIEYEMQKTLGFDLLGLNIVRNLI